MSDNNKISESIRITTLAYNLNKAVEFLSINFEKNKEAWDKAFESISRMMEPKDYDLGI